MNDIRALAGRCGSCKHWDKANEQPGYWDEKRIAVSGEWGTCERVRRYGGGTYGSLPGLTEPLGDEPVYLSDASGFFASLTSRSDFGCSLWEAKEGN